MNRPPPGSIRFERGSATGFALACFASRPAKVQRAGSDARPRGSKIDRVDLREAMNLGRRSWPDALWRCTAMASDHWSPDELKKLADLFYRGLAGPCPRCGTRGGTFQEYHSRSTSDVVLLSPMRRDGTFSADYLDEMELAWTGRRKRPSRTSTGAPPCPKDRAVLVVHEHGYHGDPRTHLFVSCRRCGRHFQTDGSDQPLSGCGAARR
jgi:hypothetical protein